MAEESPRDVLSRLISGYQPSQAIYVAAKLEIADLVKDGPRSVDDLAAATGAHAASLYRLLRALAGMGIFAEDDERRFSLTPPAELLCRDHPESQYAFAVMMGEEHYHVWGDLFFTVETGQTAFDRIYGMPIFEFLSENPEKGRIFDAAMTGIHGRETQPLLDAYDFPDAAVIADVGGGNGSVLIALLKHYPRARGVLFDLPPVIERSRRNIAAEGMEDRCELAEGSFFDSVPPGADVYLLRHIIHDWDDEKSSLILRNVRRAIQPESRALVLETILPPGNESSPVKFLDLTMMLIPGGKERTEEEYRQLLDCADLHLTRIVPTAGSISVIEAKPK
ncbi:MAG: methyltransferase [Planctomycetes bacterium]|nr:methyltransferase [Planctomycetota bacterium]